MHWPTNWAPDWSKLGPMLDGRATVMPDGEARWHYMRAILEHRDSQVIWRGMPKPGRRAAECTPREYADSLLQTLRDAVNEGKIPNLQAVLDYTYGNEPELDYELGGAFLDFGWMAAYYSEVMYRLRERGMQARLWLPGLTPDKGDLEHLDEWAWLVARCDGVIVHAYGDADVCAERVRRYLEIFPEHDILVGETHAARWSNDWEGAQDPGRNLALLAAYRELQNTYPNFAGACRYTWKWGQPADGWTDAYDVEGHPDLEAQYLDPEGWLRVAGYLSEPTPEPQPEPTPEPEPEPEPISMPTNLVRSIDVSNYQSATLDGLLDGVEHVVVRLSTETAAKAQHAVTQLRTAVSHGCTVAGYIWAYWGENPRQAVLDSLEAAQDAGIPLVAVWLDAEDASGASETRVVWWLREALDELRRRGHKGGIYTGRWFWTSRVNDSHALAGTPAWLAQYDGIADLGSVLDCGGFEVVGKQYAGDTLDLNVFSRVWLESAAPAPAEPLNDPRAVIIGAGRSRIGDPYVWDAEQPGGFDCSGFVKWAYGQAGLALTSYTDAIYDETVPTQNPQPGDIILWEYTDGNQPGVRFPHMGIWLGPGSTLEARFPNGVAEYSPLPYTAHIRRHPGLADQTPGEDPRMIEALRTQINEQNGIIEEYARQVAAKDEQVGGLVSATAHLADVIVPRLTTKRVSAKTKATATAEAKAIREQFVGVKPP